MLSVVSALCFGFASCGDDENEPTPAPVEDADITDFSKVIPGHWASTDVVGDDYLIELSIDYKGAGTISFYDMDGDGAGVMAFGTYSLSGNKLSASYTDVTVEEEDYNPTSYHGFTDGKSKTVVYTIQSCDGKKLVLKDESGKTLNYVKYADVK